MNYFLTIILLVILLIEIGLNKNDFVSPGILFSVCFFISSLFFSLNTDNWNYEIRIETALAVISGVIFFDCGCAARKRIGSIKNKKVAVKAGILEDKIDRAVGLISNTYGFIIIGALAVAVQLLSLYAEVHTINIFNAVVLRAYRAIRPVKFLIIIKLFTPLMELIAIIQISKILKFKDEGRCVRFIEYVPIIELLISTIFSSNRVTVIYLFFYIIFVYVFVNQKIRNTGTIKILFFAVKAMALLTIIFFLLGLMTGKSQVYSNVMENISLYAGSSLPALDIYLRDFTYSSSNFGRMTLLTGIGHFLIYFGFQAINVVGDEYIVIGNMSHSTNIYTMIRPLVYDFNYIGMVIALFVIGFFFQSLYHRAKEGYVNGKIFWFNIYIYAAAYLSLSSLEDKIFRSFFTLTTITFMIADTFLSKRAVRHIRFRVNK